MSFEWHNIELYYGFRDKLPVTDVFEDTHIFRFFNWTKKMSKESKPVKSVASCHTQIVQRIYRSYN